MFDKDIVVTGKHAAYIKFLAKKASELKKDAYSIEIFNRYIDVYMAGAVIGAIKNRKEDAETRKDESAKIFAEVVIREQANLKMIYRLVLLTDHPSLPEEERIDDAFRYDTNPDKVASGMEVFNAYARGGISWLYEKFSDGAMVREDYLERLSQIVEEFQGDYFTNE